MRKTLKIAVLKLDQIRCSTQSKGKSLLKCCDQQMVTLRVNTLQPCVCSPWHGFHSLVNVFVDLVDLTVYMCSLEFVFFMSWITAFYFLASSQLAPCSFGELASNLYESIQFYRMFFHLYVFKPLHQPTVMLLERKWSIDHEALHIYTFQYKSHWIISYEITTL